MNGFLTEHLYIFIGYLTLVNLTSFIVYGVDKSRAKNKMWRIPESTLMLLAAAGGSVGALLGMRVFHHKTKHPKFTVGVPLILILQAALAWYFLIR